MAVLQGDYGTKFWLGEKSSDSASATIRVPAPWLYRSLPAETARAEWSQSGCGLSSVRSGCSPPLGGPAVSEGWHRFVGRVYEFHPAAATAMNQRHRKRGSRRVHPQELKGAVARASLQRLLRGVVRASAMLQGWQVQAVPGRRALGGTPLPQTTSQEHPVQAILRSGIPQVRWR